MQDDGKESRLSEEKNPIKCKRILAAWSTRDGIRKIPDTENKPFTIKAKLTSSKSISAFEPEYTGYKTKQ